ncbi:MAG TPA: zf-TFIIB domain-containing protein [Planctomycetota bacterium]|nr:zf-TFIIB domain-containing protein [Planctomycetota bacterium]
MISIKDLLLGQLAIEKGLITPAQLSEVMKDQQDGTKPDPNATVRPTNDKGSGRPLGTLLLAKGMIKEQDLVALLEEQNRRLETVKNVQKMQKVEYLFGQLLVKYNLATMLQINKCLEIQIKMAEKGVTPIPRLGELLVDHGFVDKKTVADVLRMQDKDVLFCTGCGRQYNVVGLEEGKAYKCKECGGVMLKRALLESLKADETTFGFEMPTEER